MAVCRKNSYLRNRERTTSLYLWNNVEDCVIYRLIFPQNQSIPANHKSCTRNNINITYFLFPPFYNAIRALYIKAIQCIYSWDSGAHLEPTTLLCSCNGVFTSKVIFRLNFPRMRLPQEPDDQLQEIKLTS